MKLLKGLLAIAIVSLIAVSCKSEKKDAAESTTDEIIVVDEVLVDENGEVIAEKIVVVEGEVAEHKCDENCKKGNCPHHANDGEHKCPDAKCGEEDCRTE